MPRRVGNKRHFIKPGSGSKFRLLNRSIRDLEGYAEGAGHNVLAPIEENYEDMDLEDLKEMERDFGVNFDDDYNYMQHLKQRSAEATCWVSADNKSVISYAPSMASRASRASRMSKMSRMSKASNISEKWFEGNQELPQGYFQELAADQDEIPFDWDPDVRAQLDGLDGEEIVENPPEEGGDEEFEDFDNFIEKAMEGADEDDLEDHYEYGMDPEHFGTGERIGDMDKNFALNRFINEGRDEEFEYEGDDDRELDDEDDRRVEIDDRMSTGSERKTRFTAYSMTSSIMHRSEKLVNLDDQFEELFLEKYDEDEVGDLIHKNTEDNEIALDSELLQNAIENDYKEFVPENERTLDAIKGDKDLKASALKFVENYNSDEDEKNYDIVHVKEKPKWDCETIISTYSNLYNRPKVVEDDGFSTRSKISVSKSGMIKTDKKVRIGSELKKMEQEYQEERSEYKFRPQKRDKGETKDEKKKRKAAVKEAKRDRRIEKKETRAAFAQEFKEESRKVTTQTIRLN